MRRIRRTGPLLLALALASHAARAEEPAPAASDRIAGFVALSVGALALAGGAAANAARELDAADWNRHLCDVLGSTDHRCVGQVQRIELEDRLMVTGYALAGALLGTSIMILAQPARSASAVRVSLSFDATHAALALGGAF